MKRSKIEPKLIDHRDANAKELVWLVLHDGSRLLYGHKRLAIEYRLNLATFHYRWCKAGKPDEITLGMLAPAEGSYHGRAGQTPVAAPVVIEDIPAPTSRNRLNLPPSSFCSLITLCTPRGR